MGIYTLGITHRPVLVRLLFVKTLLVDFSIGCFFNVVAARQQFILPNAFVPNELNPLLPSASVAVLICQFVEELYSKDMIDTS